MEPVVDSIEVSLGGQVFSMERNDNAPSSEHNTSKIVAITEPKEEDRLMGLHQVHLVAQVDMNEDELKLPPKASLTGIPQELRLEILKYLLPHPILQKSQYIYWKRFPSDVAIEIFVSKAHPPISLEVALVNRQLASDSKVIMYNGTFTIRIELDKVSFQDIDMTKVINRQRLYEKVCSKLRRIPLQLVRHLEIQLIRFPFNNAYTESTLLQRMRGPLSIVCYWLRSRQDVKGALQKLDRLTIRLVDAHTDSCTWRAAIEQPKESRIRINKADEKTRYRLGYLLEVLELLWGIKQVDFDFGKYTPASKTGKLAKELVGVMTREKPKWVLPSSLRPSALGGIEPLRASDRKDKTLFHAYNKGIFR